MAAAVTWAGVSAVTLRKHLAAGRIEAERVRGAHGDEWAIDAESLAVFVRLRYGRELPPIVVTPKAENPAAAEADRLRERVDELLEEVGRYKALADSAAATGEAVETALRDHLAELRAERDAAKADAEAKAIEAESARADAAASTAELTRLQGRGFWARLFNS